MGLEAEALRLEWDGAAACKRVEDRWWVAVGGGEDLGSCFRQESFVADVLPDNQSFDDAVQPLAFAALVPLGGEAVGVAGGIVDELGEQDRGAARAVEPTRRKVDGCPCRIDFSRADSVDGLSGKATSMTLRLTVIRWCSWSCVQPTSGWSRWGQKGSARPFLGPVATDPVASKPPRSVVANGSARYRTSSCSGPRGSTRTSARR